jgi:CheY-like chemotaxis protein
MAEQQQDRPQQEGSRLEQYFATAPEQIAAFRTLFSEISRASNEQARQDILGELVDKVQSFKFNSALPELLPVSQLAISLEGLVQQLQDEPSHINLSILRTMAAAVVLLETLAAPGLKRDLTTNPPVRLLVVDDDPINRLAVASALRKTFPEPDIACDGPAALTLAAANAYDVIFLDVEMPGMDGFDVCSRIRATSNNGTTPVVFVTSHSDFESRAKSSKSGGQDLIAKPFLSFELALKALTIVLRHRLQPKRAAAQPSAAIPQPRATVTATHVTPLPSSTASPAVFVMAHSESLPAHESNLPPASSATSAPETVELAKQLFAAGTARIEVIRDQLLSLSFERDDAARKKILDEVLAALQAFTFDLERAALPGAARLTSALETLLGKFIENPKNVGPSTLNAAGSALSLLEELCAKGMNPDLSNPESCVLIVDDDPVVRLAMSGAMKSAFATTENAQNGEEALVIAGAKTFDMIFLDVEMVGMDGFTACRKIHATIPNSRTPVVFVTTHSDMESRGKAALSGCAGFVPKPALPAEITLRAVTLGLRGRIEKIKRACADDETAVTQS